MGVLDAFTSTWSNARSTFGQSTPQPGTAYDNSGTLRQLQSDLASAAPGSRWTGSAATAYDTANTEHRRVVGELANLDHRLRAQIDQSAQVVSAGRADLDAVRNWVMAAASSVPANCAGERMLLPIVQQGIAQISDIMRTSNSDLSTIGGTIRGLGEEYRALGNRKFGKEGGPLFAGGDGDEYEKALREAGLLTGPPPTGYYKEWLENAKRQGVQPEVLVDIARRHNITAESFDVLNGMEKVTDDQGKSFFLLPEGVSGEDARKAELMTYILNAGTDYGEGTAHDFEPTPYSADEVQRIIDRQNANAWSYDKGVAFVDVNGGRLMSTPNGMLMGLGGNPLQDVLSEAGGSTYGDIFMFNIDDPDDPAQQLRGIAESGTTWYPAPDGNGRQGSLDLDRLLHHEEMHSRQWAKLGPEEFIAAYAAGKFIEWKFGVPHPAEKTAGLGDGGYQ